MLSQVSHSVVLLTWAGWASPWVRTNSTDSAGKDSGQGRLTLDKKVKFRPREASTETSMEMDVKRKNC